MRSDRSTDTPARLSVSRREWLTRTGGACASVMPVGLLLAQRKQSAAKRPEEEEEDVAPPEDLMREHGVLKRVLLIYDEGIRRIDAKQSVPPEAIRNSAQVIRSFIEDYHEKLEEDYLFPRFEKAGTLGDEFEKKEHQLFGEDGFEKMVDRVAGIEKTLGIYDLAQFTPRV